MGKKFNTAGLRYEKYTYGPIIENKDYDLSLFLKDEIDIIDRVIKLFKNKKCSEISDLSHEENGWIFTQNGELISCEYAQDLKIELK